jgi:hypothetical protein
MVRKRLGRGQGITALTAAAPAEYKYPFFHWEKPKLLFFEP